MNQAEAKTEADSWEADILNSRTDTNAQLDKALSTARAKAGASGVRKGSQSWDSMMYNAAQPYNNILAGLDTEASNVTAFRGNISSLSSFPSGSGTVASRESGGNDPSPGPEPGAGFEAPTTAKGEIAQGIGLGTGQAVNEVAAGTISAVSAFNAGLNMTGVGMVANAGATLGSALGNPEEMEALKADTIDMIGFNNTLAQNVLGITHTLAIATGLYGPMKSIEAMVGHMQAGTLDDAFFEVMDTLAMSLEDAGIAGPASVDRAGRQNDRQAEEASRQSSAGMPSRSVAEQNMGFGMDPGVDTDEVGINEMEAAAQHNTAAGHQAAADSANETESTGSASDGSDNESAESADTGAAESQSDSQSAENESQGGDSDGESEGEGQGSEQ